MAKNKYIYDPNTLSYIPIETTFKDKLKVLLPYLIGGFMIGIISYVLVAFNYITPREKLQAQQIDDLHSYQEKLNQQISEVDHTLEQLITNDDSLYRTLLGAEPISGSIRQAGTGGTDDYEEMINVGGNTQDVIKSFRKVDQLLAKINVQKVSYKELFKRVTVNFDRMQHLPAIIPIANWDLRYIGSGFSPRRFHPILKCWRQHEGIDFVAPTGTTVFASADGKVKSVRVSSSFGNVIEIDHGYNIITLYAHLSKFKIKAGQTVKRGQVIGLVGSTGLSGGPHLHYEVHLSNKEVDPVNYFFNDLTSDEYKAVVAKAESVTTCME